MGGSTSLYRVCNLNASTKLALFIVRKPIGSSLLELFIPKCIPDVRNVKNVLIILIYIKIFGQKILKIYREIL